MSLWLAVISDCNPVFKMRKAHRQKDDCSYQRNCADNMANENVPSSFTATTETTSTLPPPPPPPQQSTVHRDIWSVLTDREDQAKMEMEIPHSSRVNSPPNAYA
ncbi:hypothetical protein Tco_0966949 [Tanacetum coccineum]